MAAEPAPAGRPLEAFTSLEQFLAELPRLSVVGWPRGGRKLDQQPERAFQAWYAAVRGQPAATLDELRRPVTEETPLMRLPYAAASAAELAADEDARQAWAAANPGGWQAQAGPGGEGNGDGSESKADSASSVTTVPSVPGGPRAAPGLMELLSAAMAHPDAAAREALVRNIMGQEGQRGGGGSREEELGLEERSGAKHSALVRFIGATGNGDLESAVLSTKRKYSRAARTSIARGEFASLSIAVFAERADTAGGDAAEGGTLEGDRLKFVVESDDRRVTSFEVFSEGLRGFTHLFTTFYGNNYEDDLRGYYVAATEGAHKNLALAVERELAARQEWMARMLKASATWTRLRRNGEHPVVQGISFKAVIESDAVKNEVFRWLSEKLVVAAAAPSAAVVAVTGGAGAPAAARGKKEPRAREALGTFDREVVDSRICLDWVEGKCGGDGRCSSKLKGLKHPAEAKGSRAGMYAWLGKQLTA